MAEENAVLHAGLQSVQGFTTMMMETHREQVRLLVAAKTLQVQQQEFELETKDKEIDALREHNRILMGKMMEMTELMHEASDADEKMSLTNEAMITKLQTENAALKEVIEASK